MTSRPVVVVGAGIGGLVSAAELSARGLEVVLCEKSPHVGGKMRRVEVGGASMDAGPTVFTMRWVFDELFEALGERLERHLQLQPVGVLARHAWEDGQTLDLHADKTRSADAIGSLAGSAASHGYLAFCDRAARIYRSLETPFLRGSKPNPVSLLKRAGFRGMPELLKISPFATLWQELAKYFDDPRLQQLFGRYATYCGSSPYSAPATLMLVAHVEQEGVWLVEGGMHRVASSLASLAERNGAVLRCNTAVDEIVVRNGRACGVRLEGGEEIEAGAVIFNGDVSAIADGLLGRRAAPFATGTPPAHRSLSALTWNLLARADAFPLARHTVFFSADYRREFDDIFVRGSLPASPTVYICAQDRNDQGAGRHPGAAERLLLIVNAPAHGDTRPFTSEELARCETQAFRLLANCGLRLQHDPQNSLMTTPQHFERMFPSTGGALYGRASHGWAASFQRPGSRTRLPGLYLAGGSVHPGPGVPMAALSGRQASASLLKDLRHATSARKPSTPSSRPAATPGGTSMR